MTHTTPFIPGMGAVIHNKGVHFRVWAPNAQSLHVAGEFNNWKPTAKHKMKSEGNGYWAVNIPDAREGQEYRYRIRSAHGEWMRNDPYARKVQHSNGNSIIYNTADFNWADDNFQLSPANALVIYELHVGTFNVTEAGKPGNFETVLEKIDYFQSLGVNAVQIMPPTEFPGDYSWGYNPAHPFAIETAYGGPDAFKNLVKTFHENGIGVILDVVYNHLGPNDLDLWQFDGWQENGGGGIYFYNDWRSETPWGNTRPDYGRPEVQQYIRDNAVMWLEEYRVDGLRFDMVPFIRSVHGHDDPGDALPDGFALLQRITGEIRQKYPHKILIAEDMHRLDVITASPENGGLGFHAQWDSEFVHPVRAALTVPSDEHRDINALIQAVQHRYNGVAFNRIIYTESHDEVANGRARVPEDIAPGNADSWFALKRSTLGAVLLFTAPGIPMLFQGQSMHEDGWFADTDPVDWGKAERFAGIFQLYATLIALRLNRYRTTAELTADGVEVLLNDPARKLLVYRRFSEQQPEAPGVVVFFNFSHNDLHNVEVHMPGNFTWHMHFNSDWKKYSEAFNSEEPQAPVALHEGKTRLNLPPYSAVILSTQLHI